MLQSYHNFTQLIKDTENIETLYNYLEDTVKVPLDISDLLRWQWVQFVSAYDKLIHDLVRIGIIQIFMGERTPTPKYKSLQVSLYIYEDMANNVLDASLLLERDIIIKHSRNAFQQPDKVADALSYIWNESDKWGKISSLMGMSKIDCTTYLKNIVIRRNQIVHAGDYTDDLFERQDILSQDICDIRKYILKLGTTIYDCVK